MEDLRLGVETASEWLYRVRGEPESSVRGNVDGEVLTRCYWRGGGGRSEDFGAALGCDCEAGGEVEADGEGDVIAGDEATAVGEEEEEGDYCGVVGGLDAWAIGRCGCVWGDWGLGSEDVGSGGEEFERVGVC